MFVCVGVRSDPDDGAFSGEFFIRRAPTHGQLFYAKGSQATGWTVAASISNLSLPLPTNTVFYVSDAPALHTS